MPSNLPNNAPDIDPSYLRTSLSNQKEESGVKTMNDDDAISQDKLTYFWKVFEVKNKTINQAVDSHPYVINPMGTIGREFSVFHLSDMYFYLNELSRAQGTSLEEHNLIEEFKADLKYNGKYWSKTCVLATFVPFIGFTLLRTRTIVSRLFYLYIYSLFFNQIYDLGLLLKMIHSGPDMIKNVLNLDERKSFSKIQTELFIRYCAKKEIERALGQRKKFNELIYVRILRNGVKDFINDWKLRFRVVKTKLFKNNN
ncbi:unnamed protein product [Moneuplotes crassus]|uniref:Uncharacterized protein n=1 Tax=Euplotes crassus TaxID=5936 RepID=A0AAD1XT46_EUPCR|nr:unnamed protein product [Moneuplotes crassus]